MSYSSLLTDRCDIYHLNELPSSGGNFGVPIENTQKEHDYSASPDISNIKCYVTEKSQYVGAGEPNTTVIREYMVHFLPGTDIRVHDKMVWNGEELKLQLPRNIKNHHIEVKALRRGSL